jgi:deazaflavin-dependent oxidoreductase (nitroreductase family)
VKDEPRFGSISWRAGNALVGLFARLGIGPIHLLTTSGRTTGRPHTVPVVPVEHDGRRWLVAPYGPVAWVHNARASGRVSLRYGRTSRSYDVREAGGREAAPVLRRYVDVATKTRPYFDATAESPDEAFAAEADRHPVFELVPAGSEAP